MRRILAPLLLVLAAVLPLEAAAGVTIYYEGRAKSWNSVEQIFRTIRTEAKRNGWSVSDASSNEAVLARMVDGRETSYRGPVSGVVVRLHPRCEPFFVQFDADLVMQDSVKTQFSNPAIHIKLVQLLKTIRPFMQRLSVEDEGEYWETRDRNKLRAHFDKVTSLMAETKRRRPGVKGPVTLPSGRIVDLMRQARPL